MVLCEFKAYLVNIVSFSLASEILSQKQKLKALYIKRGVKLFIKVFGVGAFFFKVVITHLWS